MPDDKLQQDLEESRAFSGIGSSPYSNRKCFGLISRQERWGLARRGWIVVLGSILAVCVLVFFLIYPFLAVTDPQPPTGVLVVEGWTDLNVLRESYAEFIKGGYSKIITSGCLVYDEWTSGVVVTYADWGADRLRKVGMPDALIQPVPCYVQKKDRTYSSAVAVKQWMDAHGIHPKQLNVVTEGAHARRSRLLFQKAFGPDVKIGIIAIESKKFDPDHWWRTSEGVRDVLGEGIAYMYARFLFSPPN
jgi:hypothetical protein